MIARTTLSLSVGAVLLLAACAAAAQTAPTAPSHCALAQAGAALQGSCGPMFGETPVFTLKPAIAVTSGVWRRDLHPVA